MSAETRKQITDIAARMVEFAAVQANGAVSSASPRLLRKWAKEIRAALKRDAETE
jgi:hypothetical protein